MFNSIPASTQQRCQWHLLSCDDPKCLLTYGQVSPGRKYHPGWNPSNTKCGLRASYISVPWELVRNTLSGTPTGGVGAPLKREVSGGGPGIRINSLGANTPSRGARTGKAKLQVNSLRCGSRRGDTRCRESQRCPEYGSCGPARQVSIWASPFAVPITVGNFPSLSVPRFPNTQNGHKHQNTLPHRIALVD